MVDTVREPLIVLDKDLRVVAASGSVYVKFSTDPDDTHGKHFYELGDGEWDMPKLRSLSEKIIPSYGAMDEYEVEHEFPRIGRGNALKRPLQGRTHFGQRATCAVP